jgi:hypothetical protein
MIKEKVNLDQLQVELYRWAVKELKKRGADVKVELGFRWNSKETALAKGGNIIFIGDAKEIDKHVYDIEMLISDQYEFDAGTYMHNGTRIWHIDKSVRVLHHA